MVGGWLRWPADVRLSTVAGRRRARQRRLSLYRSWGRELGWQVAGLHQDLSARYPVTPLVGTASAQAELAIVGRWGAWPAVVASVLVRAGTHLHGRHQETVLQLTSLQTGRLPWSFQPVWHDTGPQVAPVTGGGQFDVDQVQRLLITSVGAGDLRPGDHVAALDGDVLHLRTLNLSRSSLDIEGPLRSLAVLATKLG